VWGYVAYTCNFDWRKRNYEEYEVSETVKKTKETMMESLRS
jgi:hypothetical protein